MNEVFRLVPFAAWLIAVVAAADDGGRAYDVQKTAAGGAIVTLHGAPIAEYVVDQGNKPFLWRLIGPTGKSMTRSFPMARVPGESTDHVHQRGLTFGHQAVNGFDTWHEKDSFGKRSGREEKIVHVGAIRHRDYRTLAGGATAVIHARNDVCDAAGTPTMAEERRMTFSGGREARIIDLDIDLVAAYGPVELADRKDAGVLIRIPDSMTVDRGGTIVNSVGQRNADAWSKPATWVDCHGSLDGEHVGIAMLNHPTSFRHPTPWHVRTYGLFCANPFGLQQMSPAAASGRVSLKKGERVSLRHRVILHAGDEIRAGIAPAYEAYAAQTPPPLEP